jgi:acetolactate synthase I/II/III large subunit
VQAADHAGPPRRALDERGKRIAAASAQAFERARTEATYGWEASPISTARVSAEMWEAVKNKDWALVGNGGGRLWNIDKFYRTTGGGGASAIGSGLPMAVGAALAHKKHGRLCIGLQNDGDLMYAPGALWTAAHHRIPMLLVMHNNRAYHQEVMHIQRMANRRQRGITSAGIGTTITDPKSTTPRWRVAWVCILRDPSLIQRTWDPRSNARWSASNAAKPRSLTS